MAAFKVNLKIDQGSTFSKRVTWKAGAPAAPVDLTGCTARMQVRARVDSPETLLDLDTENGGIVLGGAAGTVEFCKLSAAESAALAWKSGVYDLEIEFPSGTVRRMLQGTVSISPEVTRG